MYCPIVLGSDKTIVSVATGHVEYHPLYISIGNPHNTIRRAHRNAVIPIAFLAIPKGMSFRSALPIARWVLVTKTCIIGDRRYNENPRFRTFKRQLYHASVSAILRPLRQGMVTPVVRICPDGHFRRVIYDMIAFIADYPEQVLLTNIVQDWCPRCTAMSHNLDVQATPRTSALTEGLINILDSRTLWVEYGINKDIIVRSRASI
jgi:hypothetical protein